MVIRDGAIDETATAARRARLAANAKPGVFAFNDQREAYEREWTDANYAVLTEVLATLPVHWRHYIKKRIFAAMEELPAHQRRGDGSEVRRAFDARGGRVPAARAGAGGGMKTPAWSKKPVSRPKRASEAQWREFPCATRAALCDAARWAARG